MWRRVKTGENSVAPNPQGRVFIGRVNGPFPAPRPVRGNVTLPTVNMDANFGGNSYLYAGGQEYGDMGLDDYRALHYYGLDGLDNIDF